MLYLFEQTFAMEKEGKEKRQRYKKWETGESDTERSQEKYN